MDEEPDVVTRLHLAAAQDDIRKFLLEIDQGGTHYDTLNEFGWSPLMQAVNNNSKTVAHFLIQRGAQVNLCNYLGASILSVACARGNVEMVKSLLQAGAKTTSALNDENKFLMLGETLSPVLTAAAHGQKEVIDLLLQSGLSPNVTAPISGVTPLHMAVKSLNVESVRGLLQAGANARAQDVATRSPLELVPSECGVTDLDEIERVNQIRQLLHTKLEVDVRADWAEDVLKCAAKGTSQTMARLLSELRTRRGCSEDRKLAHSNALNTALLISAAHGHIQIVTQLLSHGANVNVVSSEGRTPLMEAAMHSHVALTRLLLDAGADVHARCSTSGHTAFELASLQARVQSTLLRLLAQRTLTTAKPASSRGVNWSPAPSTPQPILLSPPQQQKRNAKSLPPGSPSYQHSVLKFDWPTSPKKVTGANLMSKVASDPNIAEHCNTTPNKVKNWLNRVTQRIPKPHATKRVVNYNNKEANLEF